MASPGTPTPVTLGSDGAGRVAAVGAGVQHVSPGDEVVIDPALHWGDDERAASAEFDILGSPTEGTFAERVVVPAANVHPKPPALSWEEAAAFPLAGLTAWRATVTCAGAAPGRRLLITGGGSGVSTFCLQIAHALGAEVWVTSAATPRSRAASSSERAEASATTTPTGHGRSAPRQAARACMR